MDWALSCIYRLARGLKSNFDHNPSSERRPGRSLFWRGSLGHSFCVSFFFSVSFCFRFFVLAFQFLFQFQLQFHQYTSYTSTPGTQVHPVHQYTRYTNTQGTPVNQSKYTRYTSTLGTPLHQVHQYTRYTRYTSTPVHSGPASGFHGTPIFFQVVGADRRFDRDWYSKYLQRTSYRYRYRYRYRKIIM